jgi:hypothetical protein
MAAATAERVKLDLLIGLANALAANEEVQRRFRIVVLQRLSRIETAVESVHGLQIVQGQDWQPGFEEKARKLARDTEEFISKRSHKLGIEMIKYIYGGSEPTARSRPVRGRRLRWSDWEI